MTFGDLREFFAARFRGTESQRQALLTAEYIRRRAEQSRILLASGVYHDAYQDELEDLTVSLLSLDMADPANHPKAIAILATAQGLRRLAQRLHGYAREPETRRAMRRQREPLANERREAYE